MSSEKHCFRITLYLGHYYSDHRLLCKVFISKKIKTVKDLKSHVTELFGIEDFYLVAQNNFLPDNEDVRVLDKDDFIFAVPNNNHSFKQPEEKSIINKAATSLKAEKKEKKQQVKRRLSEMTVTLEVHSDQKEQEESCPVKKKKKKKKEQPDDLVNSLPLARLNPPEVRKRCESEKLQKKINYFENLNNSLGNEGCANQKREKLNVPPEVNEKISSVMEGMKNDVLYSSTPKTCDKLNGVPMLKLEKKINVIKNIVIRNGSVLEKPNDSAVNDLNASIKERNDENSINEKTLQVDSNKNNLMETSPNLKNTRISEIKSNLPKLLEFNLDFKNGKPSESNLNLRSGKLPDFNLNTIDENTLEGGLDFRSENLEKINSVEDNELLKPNSTNIKAEESNFKSSLQIEEKIRVDNIEKPDENTEFYIAEKQIFVNSQNEIVGAENTNQQYEKRSIHSQETVLCDSNSPQENDDQSVFITKDAITPLGSINPINFPKNDIRNPKSQTISVSSSNSSYRTPEAKINFTISDESSPFSEISSDNVTTRKRKRIRKRRKKNETSLRLEMPPPVKPLFRPPVCSASPKIHIRFEDDGLKEEEDSVITIESEVNSVNETDNVELDEKEEDVGVTKDSGVVINTPSLDTLKTSDVIVFKILKLGESYTPEYSNDIIGRVDYVNPTTKDVDFIIIEGQEEFEEPKGKFSLINDEEEETVQAQENETNTKKVTLSWINIISPKLLYP